MIRTRAASLLLGLVFFAEYPLHAQSVILWESDQFSTNLTSTGALFDGQFSFELGVFDGSFVPTQNNAADWALHWKTAGPACHTTYDTVRKRYFASFSPSNNTPPFVSGRPAYVWGFRNSAFSSEWILFRAPTWNWPDAFFPSVNEWFANEATAIWGDIHPIDNPSCLMRSAETTSWSQWRLQYLTGEPLDGPNDDPDHDSVPNLTEFVFGTPPLTAGPPVPTPVVVLNAHLQITILRRIDHLVRLSVEVSSDLTHWNAGPAFTAVVSDGPAALVVRDLTTVNASNPRRFMRLKAEIPGP